jgi:hypothetical protein
MGDIGKVQDKIKTQNIYDTVNTCVFPLEIPASKLGNNYRTIIEKSLNKELGDKCCKYGYIKKGTINVLELSGMEALANGNFKVYAICSASVCLPVEDRVYTCVVTQITNASVECKVKTKYGDDGPILCHLPKDLHLKDENISVRNAFEQIITNNSIGAEIQAKIFGVRFELNDTQIMCLGRLNEVKTIGNNVSKNLEKKKK